MPPLTIHTIGHSTRSAEDFLQLLQTQGIERLADVRRYPGSRRHPHFAREALAGFLPRNGITYRHFPGLGGHRRERPDSPHRAWRVAGFRAYADYMETEEFARANAALREWAAGAPTAVMCAEAVPWRCHRQLLADALLRDGVSVLHITGPGKPQRHALPPFARIDRGRIIYDGGNESFDFPE